MVRYTEIKRYPLTHLHTYSSAAPQLTLFTLLHNQPTELLYLVKLKLHPLNNKPRVPATTSPCRPPAAQAPRRSGTTHCLSFWARLMSLSTMTSRLIHVKARDRICFFSKANVLLIYSSPGSLFILNLI